MSQIFNLSSKLLSTASRQIYDKKYKCFSSEVAPQPKTLDVSLPDPNGKDTNFKASMGILFYINVLKQLVRLPSPPIITTTT
jgi:hypothetical protein